MDWRLTSGAMATALSGHGLGTPCPRKAVGMAPGAGALPPADPCLSSFRLVRCTQRETAMIELTEEQRQSVEQGMPVRVADNGHNYVLMLADVFDQMVEGGYDASPWE